MVLFCERESVERVEGLCVCISKTVNIANNCLLLFFLVDFVVVQQRHRCQQRLFRRVFSVVLSYSLSLSSSLLLLALYF